MFFSFRYAKAPTPARNSAVSAAIPHFA
jgi:hypothetical protein